MSIDLGAIALNRTSQNRGSGYTGVDRDTGRVLSAADPLGDLLRPTQQAGVRDIRRRLGGFDLHQRI